MQTQPTPTKTHSNPRELRRSTVLALVASGHTLAECSKILDVERTHLSKVMDAPASREAMIELVSEIDKVFHDRLPALINKSLDELEESLGSFKVANRLKAASIVLRLAMFCGRVQNQD